jgi:hypothetical protein
MVDWREAVSAGLQSLYVVAVAVLVISALSVAIGLN